jgi:hypothetical protein
VLFGGGVLLGGTETETEACPIDKIGNNKDANRAVWSFILYGSFVAGIESLSHGHTSQSNVFVLQKSRE